MRARIGSACMTLGALLLLAAVALLTYNTWDNVRAGQSAAQISDTLEAMIQSDTAEVSYLPIKTVDASDIIGETEATSPAEETDTLPVVMIDGYGYIGTLSIPTLELELPIMYEWSYPGLKIAPGRYSGSAATGDLIICAHNYERHFGNLKYLEAGDLIVFTDVNGKAYYYAVKEIVILQPKAVSELVSQESGEWDLTLVTCTIGGQTRVTVRCSEIDG